MVETMTLPCPHLPLIMIAFIAGPLTACGHVLDEYLQATLVVIDPGDIRLKINLTPGVEIAEEILHPIDHDRDGTISSDEAAAYGEMLKRDLTVRLDGRDTELKLADFKVPEMVDLRTGHGIMQMEFSIVPDAFAAGSHRLTFENKHFPAFAVYLFNASRPRTASIRIDRQNRNTNQSHGEIEFAYMPPSSNSLRTTGIVASMAVLLVGTFAVLRRLRKPRCSADGR
jgi:hypothetical protein